MRTTRAGNIRYPFLYQSFKSADEIGKVINRSRSYVFKALKDGFTEQELVMLKQSIERKAS